MPKTTTPTPEELPRAAREVTRERAFAGVQQELLAEMGSAFARANEKVERAWAELDRCGRALVRPATPEARRDAAIRFNEQREKARVALWELRVHREALGIRDHRAIDRAWVLPPPANVAD